MGIKIVRIGDNVYAKGTPAASGVGYFFAILFFIAGAIMIFNGNLGATILAIIGTILIYAGAHHANKAREKKLREAGYTPLGKGVPQTIPVPNTMPVSGITCSNCGNITGTMNSFCPHCGFRLTRLEGVPQTIPVSSIKCSNCGNETDTINSFCPHCGFRLTRLEEEQKKIEKEQRELEANKKSEEYAERGRKIRGDDDSTGR